MNITNKTLLFVVICLIVSAIFYLEQSSPKAVSRAQSVVVLTPTTPDVRNNLSTAPLDTEVQEVESGAIIFRSDKVKKYVLAKEIVDATGFINTADGKPINLQSFIGKKVVLLDIWTYSCINCQRTLPYLNEWYEKYKDKGLEIIGLHVPEFEFEKDYNNVLAAVKKFGIKYPVVLDNEGVTARAYGMRYWPEEYLIDIDGFIVHKSIGEGGYAEKEAKIIELLNERMRVFGEDAVISAQVPKKV